MYLVPLSKLVGLKTKSESRFKEHMQNSVEVIRRVHVENEDAFLEIGDFPAAPNYLEIRTTDTLSKIWFGVVNMSMSPEYAEALGNALIAAAKEKLASQ